MKDQDDYKLLDAETCRRLGGNKGVSLQRRHSDVTCFGCMAYDCATGDWVLCLTKIGDEIVGEWDGCRWPYDTPESEIIAGIMGWLQDDELCGYMHPHREESARELWESLRDRPLTL